MVSVCLPSDALLQHLPSYLGFSYLGRGVSLHGCFSKAKPLLLTLDEAAPSWPWTWSTSSRHSCAHAAAAPWRWGGGGVEVVFKAMGMEEIIKGVSEAGEKTWTKDLDLEHSNILRLDFVRSALYSETHPSQFSYLASFYSQVSGLHYGLWCFLPNPVSSPLIFHS